MEQSAQNSFEQQFALHHAHVLAYIKKRIGDPSAAEDLASEVFLCAYQAFDRFNPSLASFSTWLYVIVNNKLKNYYRDFKRSSPYQELEGNIAFSTMPDLDRAIYIEQCRDALAKALSKLPERGRTIVTLNYFEHRTAAEIGSMLGITPENVRVILHRSIAKLQSLISDEFIR